uniref:Uncharacterized protein n=1 Tax=Urocitellus parryii TaxID=9999 RepID=A0A8D2H5E2_UROPR
NIHEIGGPYKKSRDTISKRILSEDHPTKKARVGQQEPDMPPSLPLSQEQLVCIQRNKSPALLRLAAHNVPVGFRESWRKPLGTEYGKPYFIKLMGFVAEERKRYTVYPPPHQVFTWTQTYHLPAKFMRVMFILSEPILHSSLFSSNLLYRFYTLGILNSD